MGKLRHFVGGVAATLVIAVAVILLVVIWSPTTSADTLDLSVGLPDTTSHRPDTCNAKCNENNDLVFVSYVRESAWGLSVAQFDNSYNNRTTAFAANYTWRLKLTWVDALEGRVVGGFMHGYTRDQLGLGSLCPAEDICPFGALSGTVMVTPHVGVTIIQFGPDVRTWALRARFDL